LENTLSCFIIKDKENLKDLLLKRDNFKTRSISDKDLKENRLNTCSKGLEERFAVVLT